jgi:hypothetical protein
MNALRLVHPPVPGPCTRCALTGRRAQLHLGAIQPARCVGGVVHWAGENTPSINGLHLPVCSPAKGTFWTTLTGGVDARCNAHTQPEATVQEVGPPHRVLPAIPTDPPLLVNQGLRVGQGPVQEQGRGLEVGQDVVLTLHPQQQVGGDASTYMADYCGTLSSVCALPSSDYRADRAVLRDSMCPANHRMPERFKTYSPCCPCNPAAQYSPGWCSPGPPQNH